MESILTAQGTAHYRIEGPEGAPLLVLSNSLGTTGALWDLQMDALRGRFRVLRHEHRGHGGTPAPPGPYTVEALGKDLVALLDALGEGRASLLGLSLGGMVAMWVAANAPERVERVVLCCTAPSFPPPEPWRERAALVRRSGVEPLVDGLLSRWFTEGYAATHPETGRAVARMLAESDPEGYAGCCEAIASADLWGDLEKITAPTLIVAGSRDPVSPPSVALAMHERVSGSALTVLPDAAHLANIQQPELFTDTVVAHLVGPPTVRGMGVRRGVLGDAHVDRAEASKTAFTAPFQDLITRYAWGEIWTRPGLDRRTRRFMTIAMMVALGRFEEMEMHVRAALADGVSDEDIAEILLQCAIYCGVPAANTAFASVRRMLAEAEG